MTNTSSEKTAVNSPANLSDQDLITLQQNPAYQNLADKSAVVGISEDGKPILYATQIKLIFWNSKNKCYF